MKGPTKHLPIACIIAIVVCYSLYSVIDHKCSAKFELATRRMSVHMASKSGQLATQDESMDKSSSAGVPSEPASPSDCSLELDRNDQAMHDYYKKQATARANPIKAHEGYGEMLSKLAPTIHCPWNVRVGRVTDGGKWMCAPWLARKKDKCLIYSLGVGGDSSFEQEILEMLPNCHIWAFDSNPAYKRLFDFDKQRTTFLGQLISANAAQHNSQSVHLPTMLKSESHKYLEILKVDIEFNEFTVLPDILKMITDKELKVCVLMIEFHVKGKEEFNDMQKEIAKAGFELYATEVNYLSYNIKFIEIGYIHKACLADYCLKKPTHKNFHI